MGSYLEIIKGLVREKPPSRIHVYMDVSVHLHILSSNSLQAFALSPPSAWEGTSLPRAHAPGDSFRILHLRVAGFNLLGSRQCFVA